MARYLVLATSLSLLPQAHALVRPDGVVRSTASSSVYMLISRQGRLPALGWNSWNAFNCDINATKILTAAEQVVNLGLKDLGYEYINSELVLRAERP